MRPTVKVKKLDTRAILPTYGSEYAAGADLPVLDHQALVARCGKTIFDQVWENRSQVKNGTAFLHHIRNGRAAARLFLLGERQLLGIRIRRVEIKGNRPHIRSIPRQSTNMVNTVLVDLIDSHIEADIICRCASDIRKDGIVGVTADHIMMLPVAVKA